MTVLSNVRKKLYNLCSKFLKKTFFSCNHFSFSSLITENVHINELILFFLSTDSSVIN